MGWGGVGWRRGFVGEARAGAGAGVRGGLGESFLGVLVSGQVEQNGS